MLRSSNTRRIAIITFCILLQAALAEAQSVSPAQQSADKLFADSKWQQAARAYTEIVAKEPANGPAWQQLGECDIHLQLFDDAITALQHAVELKYRPLMTKIDIARAYSAKADTRHALDVLKEVAATGQAPRLRGYIAGSSEFAILSNNAEYQEFLKSTAPCQAAEFHRFDFWIGDWAVQNPAGQMVGNNLVTREQDGCVLIEHWKSARGIESGTSFNYFDIRDKKWHQLYLDNSGNAGAFPPMAGGLVDDKMVLISDEKQSPVFRWTWYVLAPGKVRQMAEQSDDQQKTWRIVWDSTYVTKAHQASR
jgi:tetratricopeptide (TPR) repeat protein